MAVVLRSPHAHAQIRRYRRRRGPRRAGCAGGADRRRCRADGLQPLRPTVEANVQTGEPFTFAPQPLLARDKVRHVGEPVALIVAETRAQALDAAELVAVAYDAAAGGDDGRCGLRRRSAGNFRRRPGQCLPRLAYRRHAGQPSRLAAAPHVVSLTRQPPHRHQPDGAARRGRHLRRGRALHVARLQPEYPWQPRPTARALGVRPPRCGSLRPMSAAALARRISPMPSMVDPVGGPARRRPVKWIATPQRRLPLRPSGPRSPGRGRPGARRRRQFLALRVNSVANVGAYMAGGAGGVQTHQYVHLQGTIYGFPPSRSRSRPC